MIEINESMIEINESMIEINESMIEINESIIENNESMIEINQYFLNQEKSDIFLLWNYLNVTGLEKFGKLRECDGTGLTL